MPHTRLTAEQGPIQDSEKGDTAHVDDLLSFHVLDYKIVCNCACEGDLGACSPESFKKLHSEIESAREHL